MRPSKDKYWLALLKGVSSRASCPRRQTSAILIDSSNRILSSGYNGPPSSLPNCLTEPCGGENDPSGNTDRCAAVHAEQNALLQAGDRLRYADTLYCSHYPCYVCAKLICQSGIRRVIYKENYPDDRSKALFKRANILVLSESEIE